MNANELMRCHIEALFTHDASGDLLRVNEHHGAPAPRFFLGRTAYGAVVRYRHDVDADIRRELEAAMRDTFQPSLAFDAPLDPSPYQAILDRSAPVQRISAGPAFCFPEVLPPANETTRITSSNSNLLRPHLLEWLPDVSRCEPMVAVIVDGHAVSLCCSVRKTNMAHEAGVETAPAHRGHGYAGHVAMAWARAMRERNRVPLYSTSWTNSESRAVARKLGLILFGSDLHLT